MNNSSATICCFVKATMHKLDMKRDEGKREENMGAIVINTDIGCCMHHMQQPHLQLSSLNNNRL